MEMNTSEERNPKRPREQDSTLSPPAKKVQHKTSSEGSCSDVTSSTQPPIQPSTQFPSPATHTQLQSISPDTTRSAECRYEGRDIEEALMIGDRSEGGLVTERLQEPVTALKTEGEVDMEIIGGGTSDGLASREVTDVDLLSEGKTGELTGEESTNKKALEGRVRNEECLCEGGTMEEPAPLEMTGLNVLLDRKTDEELKLKEGSKREQASCEGMNKEATYMETDAELTPNKERGRTEGKMQINSDLKTATLNTVLEEKGDKEPKERIMMKPGDAQMNIDIQTFTSNAALATNTALEGEKDKETKERIKTESGDTQMYTDLQTSTNTAAEGRYKEHRQTVKTELGDTQSRENINTSNPLEMNSSPRKASREQRQRNKTDSPKYKGKLESHATTQGPQTTRNFAKRTRSLTELGSVTYKPSRGSMECISSTAGPPQLARTSSTDGTREQHGKKKKRSSQNKKLNTSGEKIVRPNYFVGIQVSNPAIHRGLLKVQEDLVGNDESLVRTLVDVATSHLTLLVAFLDTEDSIAGASAALEESAARMRDGLSASPITLTFSGVSHFNNQVVFAQVVEDEQHGRLLDAAECVRQVFSQHGVCMPDTRDLHPHLTIAKLSKAQRIKGKHSVPRKIDPSFYSQHVSLGFGSQTVTSLQLLAMNKTKSPQRYYHCDKEVLFDIKVEEEKDHSRCCFPRRPALPSSLNRSYSTTTTTTTTTTPPDDTRDASHSTWFVPLTGVTALVAGALLIGFALARIRGNQ